MTGNRSTVDYLLTKGADVNVVNNKGQTALHKAALYDYVDIINTLASYGADLNLKDSEGYTPLALALFHYQANAFYSLICCGADFHLEGKSGMVPLLEAAQKGFSKGVCAILERGGNVNTQNNAGNTALHLAAIHGNTSVITAILGFSPDLNIKNSTGITAADLALTSGFSDISNLLQKQAQTSSTVTQTKSSLKKSLGRGVITATIYYQEGWLMVLEKKWKKRWFELREGVLFEFEKQGGKQKKMTPLFGMEILECEVQKLPCCFKLQTKVAQKILRAPTTDDMKTWMEKMKKSVQAVESPQSPTFQSSPETQGPLIPMAPPPALTVPSLSPSSSSSNEKNVVSAPDIPASKPLQPNISGTTWKELISTLEIHIRERYYEAEWIALEERDLQRPKTLCSDGQLPYNQVKNRFRNIIPCTISFI